MERWFGSQPRNLALITGRVSGNIVALDFDRPGVYEKWISSFPDIAASTAL